MDIEQQHGPENEVDGAERAFEALREEVAAQRRALERLAATLAQGRSPDEPAPDYSPTLGAMAQELRAVGARLDGIEAQPALRLTPSEITQQVVAGVRRASEEAAQGRAQAGAHLNGAVREMRTLIGSANSQLAQRRREWIAVAIGAVLGLALWYPLVWLTPFGGGHWLAASLIGGGEWHAGATLMQEADSAAWERMARLYEACGDQATATCEAAMAPRQPVPAPSHPPGKMGR
ncbi:MAG: DUF6118 family protein [Dehalococcoidia bacterium]